MVSKFGTFHRFFSVIRISAAIVGSIVAGAVLTEGFWAVIGKALAPEQPQWKVGDILCTKPDPNLEDWEQPSRKPQRIEQIGKHKYRTTFGDISNGSPYSQYSDGPYGPESVVFAEFHKRGLVLCKNQGSFNIDDYLNQFKSAPE